MTELYIPPRVGSDTGCHVNVHGVGTHDVGTLLVHAVIYIDSYVALHIMDTLFQCRTATIMRVKPCK